MCCLLGSVSCKLIVCQSLFKSVFTCAPAMLQAGAVFWRRMSVHTKSQKLLLRTWCNLVGVCPMVNARSDWKLMTFDFDLWPWGLFFYLSIHAIYFEWLYWETSFSVWRYVFIISRSRIVLKVMDLKSELRQRKTIVCNSKTTGQKLL